MVREWDHLNNRFQSEIVFARGYFCCRVFTALLSCNTKLLARVSDQCTKRGHSCLLGILKRAFFPEFDFAPSFQACIFIYILFGLKTGLKQSIGFRGSFETCQYTTNESWIKVKRYRQINSNLPICCHCPCGGLTTVPVGTEQRRYFDREVLRG